MYGDENGYVSSVYNKRNNYSSDSLLFCLFVSSSIAFTFQIVWPLIISFISVAVNRRLWVLPVRRKASVHLWKSVRDRIHHEPRRIQKGFCSFVKLCERWNIQRALFKTKISVETNPTTTKESNTCKQGTRRALSWGKKGVFNTQGGHVLECWRASYRNV